MTLKNLPKSGHQLALTLVSLSIFVYYLRGAQYYASVIPRQAFPGGWDNGNVLLWTYRFQTGSIPYRDFWYPYGGLILGSAVFPWGFIFNAGYPALILILCLFSFYLITNRSLGRTFAIFAIWFGLAHQNMFPVIRYAILVPFLVSYACAASEKNRAGLAHVVFWLTAGASLLGDVATIVYSWTLVALALSLDAFSDWTAFKAQAPSRMKREFAVPAACIAVYVLALGLNGQIPGFVAFYRDLGGVPQYAGVPVPMDAYLHWKPFNNGFFIWGASALSALGVFFYFSDRSERREASLAILLLGICNVMLIYKQLVHTNGAYFFGLSTTIAGVLLVVLARPKRLGTAQYVAVCFVAGLWFGTFQETNGVLTLWERFKHLGAMEDDFKALTSPPNTPAEYLKVQWSLENFRQYPALLAVLNVIGPRMSAANPTDLFTLTEDQALYIMTQKRPPFYQSLYDGSLLRAQQNTVGWLETNRPSVVVYNTRNLDVFGVPGIVRDPLVYEHVILNYVSDVMVGDYAVLRRRKAGEAVDVKFWTQSVGSIDLRELPLATSISRFDECTNPGACVEFLEVRPRAPIAAPTPVSVPVTVAGDRFDFNFVMLPGKPRYVVFLNRLWFWGGLKRENMVPTIDAMSPSLEWKVVQRAKREDILY